MATVKLTRDEFDRLNTQIDRAIKRFAKSKAIEG